MSFPSLDDFMRLKERVDKLESQVASLKKIFGDLEKKIKNLNVGSGGGGADQELVDRLYDELNKLRAEFEAHRDSANN